MFAKSWVQGEAVGRCIAERDLGKYLEIIKSKNKEFRLYLTINVAIKNGILGYVEDGKDVNRFLLWIIIVTSDVHKNQLKKAQEPESPVRNFNCLYNSQEIGQWG